MGCDSALLKSLPRVLLRFTPSDHFEGNLDIVLPDYIRTTRTQTNEYTKLVQYYWYIHDMKTQRRTVCWTTSGPFRH